MKIITTKEFDAWFRKLKNMAFKTKVDARFENIRKGNLGDYKRIDEFLWELRFRDSYRIYYIIIDNVIVVYGGHKDTQSKDILKAQQIIKELIL